MVVVAAFYGVSAIVALFRSATAELVSQRRLERLREEIDAGKHFAPYERRAPPKLEDELAAIDDLPYLSPPLRASALAAALAGEAPMAAAADAADVAPERFAAALEEIRARTD